MSTTLVDKFETEAVAPEHTETEASSGEGQSITIIEASHGWRLVNFAELYAYRDLYRFLTWRSIKVRYAQSAVGIGWAVMQPAFQIAMFSLVFGRLAQIDSDGVPYAAFSLATIVAWTYFANALNAATDSLVGNSGMISKVYFPRIVLPMAAVSAALFDYIIAFFFALLVLLMFGFVPNGGILMLPVLVMLMVGAAFGLGLWATALAIQYRDVKHAMTFLVQLAMYASPVIYPTSKLPENYHLYGTVNVWPQYIYALNPMVGVLEGFRSALVGTRSMPYGWIAMGATSVALLTLSGTIYFRSREKLFADVA
jgi:lipopolysaccharide transport system permease protein